LGDLSLCWRAVLVLVHGWGWYGFLQRIIHFGECLFSLLEESKDDGFAEIPIVIVIHFQDLLKGDHVD
jgi:hypothetical protein